MMNGQPDLSLGIEDAAQVGPGHGKIGPSLDGFQVASLIEWWGETGRDGVERDETKTTISHTIP